MTRQQTNQEETIVVSVGLSAEHVSVALKLSQEWGLTLPEVLQRCLHIMSRLPELAKNYDRAKLPRPKLIGPRTGRREEAAREAKFDAACSISEVVSYELALLQSESKAATG